MFSSINRAKRFDFNFAGSDLLRIVEPSLTTFWNGESAEVVFNTLKANRERQECYPKVPVSKQNII